MAEAFSNKLARAVGIVSTVSAGSVGVTTNHITGITTVDVSVGDLISNANYIHGTKVQSVGLGSVIANRDSTNTTAVDGNGVFKFLGITSAYVSPAATKSILIGGTFGNNTDSEVKVTIEVHDSSTNIAAGLGQDIPVPTGSSFVISDAGKTVLEANDSLRIYCDTANGVDVTLAILTGVS
tara:strand:+ start:107 stop:649 length:543 start_codon:yes stop_codon:yes gene_type:complete